MSLCIKDHQIREILKSYSLTDAQIVYVASCAGLHYELGKIRSEANKSELGYTIAFTESEQCKVACSEIARQYPKFKTEIGILFLCDSLAKTEVQINAKDDSDIETMTASIQEIVQNQGLNPKLIAAIKQRPVNIAVAHAYLKTIKVYLDVEYVN